MFSAAQVDLHASGLHLQIIELARTRGPDVYDNWIQVRVDIEVPNFRGQIRWSVLENELLTLAADLERLNKHVGDEHQLSFTPVEPGVTLHLHMNSRGQIEAAYRFTDTSGGPYGPELSGACGFDQTYLASIARSLKALAKGS